MTEPILGSETIAAGLLTRGQLRWNYRAILPDVYLTNEQAATLAVRTRAAWLWTGRQGVITGQAASALHGALWVDDDAPVELLWSAGRPPAGIIARNERFEADELVEIGGLLVANPARTALDLGRHLSRGAAVEHLDSLSRATGLEHSEVSTLIERYPGARGVARSRIALDLMDAGAQSPKETWLRLLLIRAGFPRPRTQIHVSDGFTNAFLDMGWDDPMIGVDYDGKQHSSDRVRYVHDIGRNEMVRRRGWIDLHVVAEHSKRYIIQRVDDAFARRGMRGRSNPRRNCA